MEGGPNAIVLAKFVGVGGGAKLVGGLGWGGGWGS